MKFIGIPEASLQYTYALLTLLPLLRMGASQIAVSDCGVSKGCFRRPIECDSVTSCDVIVTWQQTPDRGSLMFELAGVSTGYVAVGFSGGRLMANTDVLVCINNNGVTLQHFYNPVHHVNEPRSQIGVTGDTASSANGVIQCRFTRVKYIAGQQDFADLREDVFLLVARGLQSNGFPTYHTLGKYVSSSKEDLSKFQATSYNFTTVLPSDESNGILMNTNQSSIVSTENNMDASLSPTSPSNTAYKQHTSTYIITMVTAGIVIGLHRLQYL